MSPSRLTGRGWASKAYYLLRSLVVSPARPDERCFMGAPIGDDVHCPRRRHAESLWCLHHEREIERSGR